MCLAIPAQIVEIVDRARHLAKADVSGVRRTINVGLIGSETLAVGDWVLIHVGFALSLIDETEARRTMDLLRAMGEDYQSELRQIDGSRIE
ncbi:MAG TPA: HypC/HybG/HupF family hydrogenase formation chaperone [Gemmatimonadaceae bacterium]|nr:HypC/HybG/HupF family hydrogenase formation chaperone [Gemmatimonadaceae bacterium]